MIVAFDGSVSAGRDLEHGPGVKDKRFWTWTALLETWFNDQFPIPTGPAEVPRRHRVVNLAVAGAGSRYTVLHLQSTLKQSFEGQFRKKNHLRVNSV